MSLMCSYDYSDIHNYHSIPNQTYNYLLKTQPVLSFFVSNCFLVNYLLTIFFFGGHELLSWLVFFFGLKVRLC